MMDLLSKMPGIHAGTVEISCLAILHRAVR